MRGFISHYVTVVQSAIDADFLFFAALMALSLAGAILLILFLIHLIGLFASLALLIASILLLPPIVASACIAALGLPKLH